MALLDVEQALVINLGEFAQTVEVGLDEFRVAGVIVLPGDHFFAVGCHGLSPCLFAWMRVLSWSASAVVEASIAGGLAQNCARLR